MARVLSADANCIYFSLPDSPCVELTCRPASSIAAAIWGGLMHGEKDSKSAFIDAICTMSVGHVWRAC